MANSAHRQELEKAAEFISSAKSLLIVAGAGMGVDSGLPDFRGDTGFWRAYPALGRSGIDFYSAATPSSFRKNPQLAWGFYGHRLDLYRRTQPHAGYQLLTKWGSAAPDGYLAFTTNVDGHFQKAGFLDDAVVECHGSINHLQCLDACSNHIWPADDFVPHVDEDQCLLLNPPPLCSVCGGLARPNILMFDDAEWISARTSRQEQRLSRWLANKENGVVVEIGAGTAVATARMFSEQVTRALGGTLIRINPREPEVSDRRKHVGLGMGALEALQTIDQIMTR